MNKAVNLVVDNCIGCPYCFSWPDISIQDKTLFASQCTLAKKRIGGNKEVTKKTPIPKWCPLPDSERMQYYVVKEELKEIDDDTATVCQTITAYEIGQETWILGSWEKTDAVLVNDIDFISEQGKKVVVIYGRIISEGEVDLDRGNNHPSRKE